MTPADDQSDGILQFSACEMVSKLASRELSAREVVEAHVERIQAVNGRLNVVVVPLFEQARADAAAADAALDRGESPGPLHGLPLTIKEYYDVAGAPTTMGLLNRVGHRAAGDALVVARLREAGAIVLCKTNAPQPLMTNETDNPVYGRTNNPWNLERGAGGSSGGEASIVAAGGSPLGLGSDLGGSVRLPAHACGVAAFKPTSGRSSMKGHANFFAGQEATLCEAGPVARRVADLQLLMRVLFRPGLELLDPSVAPVPLREPGDVSLKGLRVATYEDNGVCTVSPALRRAVRESAEVLRARGVEVEEWTPPGVPRAWQVHLQLLFADGMAGAKRLLRKSRLDWRAAGALRGALLPGFSLSGAARLLALAGQPRLGRMLPNIRRRTVDEYWRLVHERSLYRARFVSEMRARRFDAILCPPDALPALRHGSSFYLGEALSYAGLYNLLGMPAGVLAVTRVRAGEESDRASSRDVVERAAREVEKGSVGLPVGVQVVAHHWREDVALALMSALEEDFKGRPDYPARPPL